MTTQDRVTISAVQGFPRARLSPIAIVLMVLVGIIVAIPLVILSLLALVIAVVSTSARRLLTRIWARGRAVMGWSEDGSGRRNVRVRAPQGE